MENKILTCHLTCIICWGLSHEKWIFKLYMSLDGHFYYVYVFLTSKMAFDEHDTRQIPALCWMLTNLEFTTFLND